MSQLDVTSSNETTGAGVIDSWHSFASSIESIKDAHGADKAAVAVEIGITGASAVLDTVAFALDPLAKLISAGLGWLIEHVEFLRWPLDQIAGNPDQIQALATSLHTIGQNLRNSATDLDTALKTDITQWQGQAADAFTSAMNGHKTHIDDAGHSVDTVGYVVETTMALIAAVRALFRDIITTVLGDIIATMLVALAAAAFTFGASIAVGVTKCVVEGTVQVASMTAKLAKVADLAGRTASRIRQLTGMTKGETSAAGHELGEVPAAPHASGSNTGGHNEPPTPNATTTPAAHTGEDPGSSPAAPPQPHDPGPSNQPGGSGEPAPPVETGNAVPHPNDGDTPSSAGDPPAAPPTGTHDDPTVHPTDDPATGGDPNANDYSVQQGILDDYHNNPAGSDDGASAHGDPNASDYSAQQGILDDYHDNPSSADPHGSDAGSSDGTSTSGVDEPPAPTPAPTPTPEPVPSSTGTHGDDPATASGSGTPHDDPPADDEPGTPHDEPPATPADNAPAAPKPPDPKSALKDQDISLLKKHEDWLKNNFKESQAKAKFVDNWVKKNAPDSYPLVKAMADAKSSKNWVGWVNKSAVQVDKQLTTIQQQAEAAWQQSNDQWRAQHPDPAAGAMAAPGASST
ncbi:MAG TPA: hypothetical protein VHX38_23155 [Pseudonocardiaceae bacterium]|jgi:uncharacterized protein YukE|nr:hypothetical protein [Pseudonocardiaceae bacterium]